MTKRTMLRVPAPLHDVEASDTSDLAASVRRSLRPLPMEISDPTTVSVTPSEDGDGLHDVEMALVREISLFEKPRIGSWKFWRWRPWLRFMRHSWTCEAFVDEEEDVRYLTVHGRMTESLTFHRSNPDENTP